MGSKTYISLLRGINVGGQKKILMKDLKSLYESIGLKDVKTYVQSGNVIFRSDKTKSNLAHTLEEEIEKKFEYRVPVLVKDSADFSEVASQNPFVKRKGIDVKKLAVVFLFENPAKSIFKELNIISDKGEEFIFSRDIIYLYYPNGYGSSKFDNNFYERKLGITATSRNWNTVNNLLKIAGEKF